MTTGYQALTCDDVGAGASPELLVKFANRQRLSLHEKPSQSKFNVVALFFIVSEGKSYIVEGLNAEQGYVGGAICAERSAMTQLRKYAPCVVEKVVITTDSEEPISPGVLCREYMMSECSSDMPIVLGNASGSKITQFRLGEIHPAAYVYRKYDRDQVISFATGFAQQCANQTVETSLWTEEERYLYRRALGGIDRTKRTTSLHPITFSAAVMFSPSAGSTDGKDVEVSGWLPALEFGASLCPVQLILREFEKRRQTLKDGSFPSAVLVMVDNLGIAHAPFASARSLLSENGYKDTRVLYHGEDGTERRSLVEELVPPPPGGAFLTHDAFIND